MSKFEKVRKILENLSLQDAHIELDISFMLVYDRFDSIVQNSIFTDL